MAIGEYIGVQGEEYVDTRLQKLTLHKILGWVYLHAQLQTCHSKDCVAPNVVLKAHAMHGSTHLTANNMCGVSTK